ncbi:MAG TPA: O-antigen ligase family protein, partial [Candidatus Wallbacteria bacterium]|nr:O-antigen ligase family protein [Candidatus Wallbacteria bacterium]
MAKKEAAGKEEFFDNAGRYAVIITAVLTLYIFTTVNTTSFVVPKSFLLRLLTFSTAIFYVFTRGFKLKSHPVNFALFCYFLSIFFSVFSSVNSWVSLLRLSEYASYFLIFIFTFNYFDRRNLGALVKALLYSAVPIVFYGVLQYMQIDFDFWEKPQGRMDLFSTLGNVNWYALYLSAIIPLAVYGAFRKESAGYEKAVFNVLLFFSIASLIISYSRTAVIASVVSAFIGSALYLAANRFSVSAEFVKKSAFVCLIAAVVAAVFSFYNPVSSTRFAEGGFLSRMKAGFSLSEHNVAQRLFIWRVSLDMFMVKPVLGLGPGAFKIKYLDFQKDFLKRSGNAESFDDIAGNAKEAHNDYVQTLTECGAAGLLAMLYFFFVIFRQAAAYIIYNQGGPKFLAIALAVSLSAFLTGALADFPFHIPPNAMLIFILAAMLLIVSGGGDSAEEGRASSGALSISAESVDQYSLKLAFGFFAVIAIIFLVILPFTADCLAVIGQNYLKEHRFNEAVPYLSRAVSLNPAQGDALYLLGTAYVGMAAPANSKLDAELLDRGRDLLIKSKNYTIDKGIYNNLGFISIRKQLYDDAVGYFENAIGCDPKSADSLNNLGIVYFHKKVYDKAEYYYNKALKMNPYFLTAVNNLG